jgi:hypothetical protein
MRVVVLFVLAQCVPQVGLVPDQHAVQKFVPAALDPTLHDCVHGRHLDAGEGQCLYEVGGEDGLGLGVHERGARL